MNTKNIGEILKKARKKANIKVADVSKILKDLGIEKTSIKTIYSWESGKTQPTPDIFLELCKLYNIQDILLEFKQVKSNDYSFSDDTLEVAKAYEKASEKDKRTIKLILDIQVKEIANNQKQITKDEEIERKVNRYRQQLITEKKRELCNSTDLEEQEGKAN